MTKFYVAWCNNLIKRLQIISEIVAMLLDWNLSSRPFLGQVVNLDVLLCTEIDFEHAVLFLGHICSHYQRR